MVSWYSIPSDPMTRSWNRIGENGFLLYPKLCSVSTTSSTRFPRQGDARCSDHIELRFNFLSGPAIFVLKKRSALSEGQSQLHWLVSAPIIFHSNYVRNGRYEQNLNEKWSAARPIVSLSDEQPSNDRFDLREINGHPGDGDRKPKKPER
jgi:hypothetical protein